jgi:iron complex outermembrane receptor protein
MRWQVFDAFALRGSVGTTFRAPPETLLAPGYTTTLAFTSAVTGYRPYDNYGNPDLEPETADTFNFGFIVQAGGFNATVDYWKFKFEDSLDNEPGTSIVATVFPTGQPNRCADPAYAGLVARMTFANGVCSAPNLLRTRANNINGPDVDVAGIDASASFTFQVGPGDMTLGVDGTYNLEFDSEALLVEGVVIEAAGDRIGTRGTSSGTLPEWKAAAYVDFGTDMHNVRWTTRYVDGVEDGITPSRASIFVTNPNGREVEEFITSDLSYRLTLPSQLTIGASVFNVFDEEPPFARLDLSYDPFIGNPLGRYYKVSVGKKF